MAELNVNDIVYEVALEPHWSLLYVLREKLGLTGTKEACKRGECGHCTVLINAKPVLSCLTLAIEAEGSKITTIEGLEKDRELHPIQKAFLEHHGLGCGYCTPAMILCAKALLDSNPSPNEEDCRKTISGVLCRCTGYVNIVKSIMAAAETLKKERGNVAKAVNNR